MLWDVPGGPLPETLEKVPAPRQKILVGGSESMVAVASVGTGEAQVDPTHTRALVVWIYGLGSL